MRKASAILFLLSFLNATTAFGEILKLPILIHHYFEHSQEDKDASVFRFFAQHYKRTVDHEHQNSHNDHEKLPFKTTIGHVSSAVSTVLPSIGFSLTSIMVDDLTIPGCNPQVYSNVFLNSIWQPPRF